jgi:hypothetical protein
MNQDFPYYFCMMIEGSGSEPEPDPGVPKTCGSPIRNTARDTIPLITSYYN